MNRPIVFLGFLLTIFTASFANTAIRQETTKPDKTTEITLAQAQELLHKAILNDSAEDVREALQFGANVNKGKDGKAALLWAVLLKRSRAVDALLSCGANVNITYSGSSLVLHAVKLGDFPSATLLVKKGADFSGNIGCENVMTTAMRDHALEFIQELINHGWDIHNNTDGYAGSNSRNARITNIWWEICKNRGCNNELLKLFLRNGANPNQIVYNSGFIGASWTPLLLAIQSKEAIKILLDAGADIHQMASPFWLGLAQHTPISFAVMIGNVPTIEYLLERGARL